MKTFALTVLGSALASAIELTKENYASGAVHEALMAAKHSSWDIHRAAGEYESSQYPALTASVKCEGGLAIVEAGNPNQTFKCNNMDLLDFKSHADLGSWAGEGSSSWGWVSDDGREFAAIGQADGTAFAEITPEGKLVYLARLPQNGLISVWREIRTWKHYAIIGSEAYGHGIQIFDMTKLLDIDPSQPKNFSISNDVTGHFRDLPFGRTHNVVVPSSSLTNDWVLSVGAQPRNDTCRSGLIFIDVSDPTKPFSPGCAGQDGYVHDAQCVVYNGPDKRYLGKEICIGYNEDSITVYDVTNKVGVNSSVVVSKLEYTGASYTHQGWFLDENWHQYILLDDELDEEEAAGPAADGIPVTYIIDMTDLENPVNTGFYKTSVKGIDHNQYVFDGLDYQSNYGAGIRVLDVSSIPSDPTGAGISEVAYFDIYPEDDALPGGGLVDFVGTWSHYAGYPSGNILVNTIERGAFVVKLSQFEKRGRGAHYYKPRNTRV